MSMQITMMREANVYDGDVDDANRKVTCCAGSNVVTQC